MASLKGSTIASSYKSLLKLNGNTDTLAAGNGSNAIQIVHSDDSTGVTSPLFLNTDRLGIGGQPNADLEIKMATDKHMLFSDSQGETGTCPTIHTTNTAGDALVEFGIRASEIRLATGNAKRMVLDDNSKISLSNNDSGSGNTIFGSQAMNVSGASASHNVAVGNEAMHDVSTSQFNVAVGSLALTKEVNGDRNVAVGYQSLYSQSNSGTEVTENVGVGVYSGFTNVTGTKNTYVGGNAGFGSASGSNSNNVGIGYNALLDVTTGSSNVALGKESAQNLTDGQENVIIGDGAGQTTTSVHDVVVVGRGAMQNGNVTNAADGTVAVGYKSLEALVSGAGNVAVGSYTGDGLTDGGNNVLIGHLANSAGGASASQNVGIGVNALLNVTSSNNVAVGYSSMGLGVSSGGNNVAVGRQTLEDITSGADNSALGHQAGANITTGNTNVAVGRNSLVLATACTDVVSMGAYSMDAVTTSTDVNGTVAIGKHALSALTSGAKNVAIGYKAGESYNGLNSTIIGYEAGLDVDGTSGNSTLIGMEAGKHLDDGTYNTAIGIEAMKSNSGGGNTALGNTCIGWRAGDFLRTGTYNVVIGHASEVSATDSTNQIVIGREAVGVADNSVTLGNADVTDVYMAQDSGATVHADYVLSQGNQNHVANTMSSPYYRFDGTDDYVEIADTDNLSFVSGGFTFSAWVYMEDKQFFPFFGKGDVSTNWEYLFRTDTDGKFQVYVSDFGSSAFWQVAGTNVLPENKWIHVAVTYDGGDASSSFKLYLNGVSETVASATESGSYVAIENLNQPVRIGRYSTTYGQGQIACVRAYNTPLIADEIKIEYSGTSVPYKYKGANQTASYTSDFSSGVDSWAAVRATAAGNIDSIGGQNDTLRVTIDGSSGTDHYVRRAGSGMTAGKLYRAKFDYYIPSGNSVVDQISVAGAGNEITIQYLGTTDSWVTKTIDFNNPYNTAVQDFPIIFSGATGGSNVLSGTSAQNDVFYIKNFTFTPIGAVAEYDGSGIASDKWFDKSGNDLHGTVSGATVENAPTNDDGLVYEEGSHSPTITGSSSGSMGMNGSFDELAYTRIGRNCTVTGLLYITSDSSISGDIQISLPFACTQENDSSDLAYGACQLGGTGTAINGTPVIRAQGGNSHVVIMVTPNDGSDISTLTHAEVDGTWFVGFTITYMVA